MKLSAFIRTWRRAEYWAIVALLPGDLPSLPDTDKYIRSVCSWRGRAHQPVIELSKTYRYADRQHPDIIHVFDVEYFPLAANRQVIANIKCGANAVGQIGAVIAE